MILLDLSIIIVTYNSEIFVEKCIMSIIENTSDLKYEIIVVDNASTDNTVKTVGNLAKNYNNIRLVISENKGFNAGNNKGIKIAEGEYIALLNPDTILINNAFKIIIEGMKSEVDVGACGGTLLMEDMSLNMSLGSFPSLYDSLVRTFKLRNDSYYLSNVNEEKMRVPFPSGADLVFKSELIDRVGYMDERYFLYFDEADFAYSMNKLGLKSYLFTKAKIIHLQGKSTETVSEFAKKNFLDSYIKYLLKNVNKVEAMTMTMIKIIEHVLKILIIYPLKVRFKGKYFMYKEELSFYRKVWHSITFNNGDKNE